MIAKVRTIPISVILSFVFLLVFAVWILFSSFIAPGALRQDLAAGITPAGTPGHIFGTDSLGRDVWQLSIAGARSALLGPLVVAIGSMLIGIIGGLTSAYWGGWWDGTVSRISEFILALPVMLMAIVVAGILGGGYWLTVAVLIVLFAPSDVRMVRAATLQQLSKPYVESAKVLRVPTWQILVRHLLPNVMPIIWASFFVNIAFALVSLSSLSYLGLGVSPQDADWGRQLADGRALLFSNPAAAILPGILIILAATAVNLTGDWLVERLKEKGRA